jgi:hypothetical protein
MLRCAVPCILFYIVLNGCGRCLKRNFDVLGLGLGRQERTTECSVSTVRVASSFEWRHLNKRQVLALLLRRARPSIRLLRREANIVPIVNGLVVSRGLLFNLFHEGLLVFCLIPAIIYLPLNIRLLCLETRRAVRNNNAVNNAVTV